MPDFDIPISADLNKTLGLPPAEEIKLPAPDPLKIQLPTGFQISALTDLSKGIPNDCSMTFNLMLQLAPLLGAMECIVKMLKLLKPLIDVVDGLPAPPVKAIQEFAKAAVDLAPCLLIPTPANMIPFVRDILCLILKMLKCLLGQLKTLIGIMSGLELRLGAAAGNPELTQLIECAQDNAQTSGQHMMQAIEPIKLLLEMAGPLLGIAGVEPIKFPAMGSESDLESLQNTVQTLQGVVGTIQIVVDTLGGCPE